ncbi:MAG TPA: UDP-N-acetylglucosamine 2-epimerase (hydrolyzing) [Rhizobiales bacterium]|nr:UDP-N-acetylglucosamine 2-epimerase (hydrolyzing) [Hyphomicrobiales bacterium]
MKRKVCVVVTARPSYARIRSALYALKERDDVELQIVLTASALLERYGRIEQVVEADGFDISWRIQSIIEGESLLSSAKSTAIGLAETATAFYNLRPDVVVSIADRFETIATAIAAAYMNIPLAHIQGGEVTGSIDDRVRHAVTKLADLHLVASKGAAKRVESMSEHPDSIFVTGCPSIDIADSSMKSPNLPDDFFHRFGGVGSEFNVKNDYLVVMQHPVTTEYEDAYMQAEETLKAIAALDMRALWFWPNVDAGSDATSKAIRIFREKGMLPKVHFFRNVPPEDFIRVLVNSKGIVGNSSVAIRECSYLGVPAVNIGSRQNARERGPNVIDVAHDSEAIIAAVQQHLDHGKYAQDTLYGDGMAGEKIAEILATSPLMLKHEHILP